MQDQEKTTDNSQAQDAENQVLSPDGQSSPQGEDYQSSNKRIAKNSVALYLRMFFTMMVGFYTSRVVLNSLGVDDFGIFGVVGGVISIMWFITTSMSGATSRFLTFELGRSNFKRLRDTFSSAVIIQIGVALLILLLGETIGLWFVTHKLVIPADRVSAAYMVYQLAILDAMSGIIRVPYSAALIAHEKISVYAYFEILTVVLKLIVALMLAYAPFDRLILYSALLLAVNVFMTLLYCGYCLYHFKESRFRWTWKPDILKPMLSFSGWDLFGNASNLARTQGVNMLANMFFGTVANAAITIAFTVQSVVLQFASNVSTAVRPQVVKTYSVGDTGRMTTLIYASAKYLYLLLLLVSVPIFMETYYVLELWLKIVPQYTVWFVRILIFFNFFSQMSVVMAMGIHATGKIKRISIINGSLYLSVLPFTYICYKLHGSIYVAFIFNVVAVFIGCLCNVYTLGLTVKQITIYKFFKKVLLPITPITVLAFVASYAPRLYMPQGIWRLIVVTLISTIVILVMTYVMAEPDIKKMVKRKIKQYVRIS